MQYGQLLIQLLPASGIELGEDLAQEDVVLVTRGKVTAAAQLQTLIDGPVEAVVALLDVAVFVRTAPGWSCVPPARSGASTLRNAP